MSTRVADRVDSWKQQSFADGYRGLGDLADADFSGVVRANGAALYMTKGTVVGIESGSIEDFEGASGTAYRAPSPALPLLAVMQNRGDEVRAKCYTEDTPIAEVDYSPDWHAPSLDETKGTALERISPSGRAGAASNWTSSTNPAGGTPGQKNAVSLAPPENASDTGLQIEPSPFSVERDGATRIQYTFDEVPNLIRARIFDARGRQVRTLEDARLTGRSGELVWEGRDDAGNRVRVGVYVVLVEAVQTNAGTVASFKEPVVVGRPLN
jgi:hypothetical protein